MLKARVGKWYVGAMNDAYHVIDKPPQPGPIDYFCSSDHHDVNVIVSCGTDKRLADLLVTEHNARLPLDCAMCSAPGSFVISPLDPAVGYCFKEGQAWRINIPFCDFCGKQVKTRYCEMCKIHYCNEGEDDDRFCAIEHENKHENAEASERLIDEWLPAKRYKQMLKRSRMSNLKAIETLIREGQRDNLTKSGRRRVEVACDSLGLDEAETTAILLVLEYPPPPNIAGSE